MSIYAPYNFVPLSRWVYQPDWAAQVSHDIPFEDGINGVLNLKIHNHTPLLIGNGGDGGQPETVDFYRLPDGTAEKPGTAAIPGTGLKGMIRNVLEIASYGKMQFVDDKRYSIRDLTESAKPYYRDILMNKIKSGWLRFTDKNNDGRPNWQLTPCKFTRLHHDDLCKRFNISADKWDDLRTAAQRYRKIGGLQPLQFDIKTVKNGTLATNLDKGNEHGFLVMTGQPGVKPRQRNNQPRKRNKTEKRKEFLFYAAAAEALTVPARVMQDFLFIHGEGDEWQYWKNQTASKPGIPVFYIEQQGSKVPKAMGLAMMFKLAYQQTIHHVITNTNGQHLAGPEQEDCYDLAELMFGAIREQEGEWGLRGRVSFSTAVCEQESTTLTPDPTILNGPKPTYFPSYVQQKSNATGTELASNKLPYQTFMSDNSEIRGWKRYPVRSPQQAEVQPLDKDQENNKKVQVILRPLDKGAVFNAKVRLHNVRPQELGALVWALTWGGDSRYRHALGMGKSFGFGQISIAIDSYRLTDNQNNPIEPQVCQQAFIELMEQQYQAEHDKTEAKWIDSEPLVHLLAMANPEQTSPHLLKHMTLKQFASCKKDRAVLPPYVRFQGQTDAEIFAGLKALTPAERKAKRARQEQERLEAEKQAALEAKRQQELAQMSPLQRSIQEVIDNRSDKNVPENTTLFNALTSGRWSGEEAAEAAELIKKRMEQNGEWRPESKSRRPERDKAHQRTLTVMKFLKSD